VLLWRQNSLDWLTK